MSNVLVVITGSVAAFKGLELIRSLKSAGHAVKVILTGGALEFITPLSATALSGSDTYTELFSATDEAKMSHIELARWPDQILVAPASANFIARIARGESNDLAGCVLLATAAPVTMVPAMNWAMWENKSTQGHVKTLSDRGIKFIGPDHGNMACGEEGFGKMSAIAEVVSSINSELQGVKVLVTAGPTRETIDSVRYISNHSSGKQGYAIAEALKNRGAIVTLVSGPTSLRPPHGVNFVQVTNAREMLDACMKQLPQDVGIFAAAVSDWCIENPSHKKIKKGDGFPQLSFSENPDILKTVATSAPNIRPKIVIGFAAETNDLYANATNKLDSKKCDFIVANDVSQGVFGSDKNKVCWIGHETHDEWPEMSKQEVAAMIAEKVIDRIILPRPLWERSERSEG